MPQRVLSLPPQPMLAVRRGYQPKRLESAAPPAARGSLVLQTPVVAIVALAAILLFGAALGEFSIGAETALAPVGKSPAGAAAPAAVAATATVEEVGPFSRTASLLERLQLRTLVTGNPLTAWWFLLGAVLAGLLVGRLCTAIAVRLARRFAARGWHALGHLLVDLVGPANLALLTFALTVGLAGVKMSQTMSELWQRTVVLLYMVSVFWYAYNATGMVDLIFRRLTAQRESALERLLAPLVRKIIRSFLVVLCGLFALEWMFRQDIGAWLAGLGIAGVAISLAAQDSLKNLFGSITILIDRPFQLGDRIIFGPCDGLIEDIGLRSTKVRTHSGHVVTIPNSKISSDPVENISTRPYIRRSFNVQLPMSLPRDRIDLAVRTLRGILEEEGIGEPIHPIIKGEAFPPRVYLDEFTRQMVNITVNYWFAPPVHWDYLAHAQKVNLRIFERFEQAKMPLTLPVEPDPSAVPPPGGTLGRDQTPKA